MSALNKIIEEIMAQAQARADEILAAANQEAAEIRAQGQEQREEYKRRFEENAGLESRKIASRAEAADRQARRLALLVVRNQVLDEVMAEAKAKLAAQADQERFQSVWQGDVLLDNSLDAIFEAEGQALRDKAYEVLIGGEVA